MQNLTPEVAYNNVVGAAQQARLTFSEHEILAASMILIKNLVEAEIAKNKAAAPDAPVA